RCFPVASGAPLSPSGSPCFPLASGAPPGAGKTARLTPDVNRSGSNLGPAFLALYACSSLTLIDRYFPCLPAERRSAMKRAQRAAFIVGSLSAAVLVTTGLVTTGIPAQAARASAPNWQIVATVHYGPGGNASGYSAVVAPKKSDAWVFGGTNPGGASSPTAEHWDGRRWQPSPLPPGLSDFIVAADASSARNVWAVGAGYALRWNGSRWSVAKTWPQ